MSKKDAGKLGGLVTSRKYGAQYMAEIGARGAMSTWQRYKLMPYGIGGYAMIDRSSGQIKAVR